MKLLWKADTPDARLCVEAAKKGYGCGHPERINGFAGAFLKDHPDVYVSDALEARLSDDPGFEEELRTLEKRFRRNDYGSIQEDDALEQLFRVYTSGCRWTRSVYETTGGVIVYDIYRDKALFYLEGEQDEVGWVLTAQLHPTGH